MVWCFCVKEINVFSSTDRESLPPAAMRPGVMLFLLKRLTKMHEETWSGRYPGRKPPDVKEINGTRRLVSSLARFQGDGSCVKEIDGTEAVVIPGRGLPGNASCVKEINDRGGGVGGSYLPGRLTTTQKNFFDFF